MPEVWVILALPVKALFYASSSIAIGLVVFKHMFLSRKHSEIVGLRKLASINAIIATALAILFFMIQGAQLTGDASGLFDFEMLELVAQGPQGTTFSLQIVGLGLLIVSLLFLPENPIFPLLGGVLTLISFLWVGHTNGIDFFPAKPALLIHVTVFTFWIGAVWPLYRLLDYPEFITEVAVISHKFGRMAFIMVPIMLIAGGIMATSLLSHPTQLFTSVYGVTLMVKILVVSFLMILAGLNKFRFVPALLRNDTGSAKKFQHSILAEAVCFSAILMLSAIITGAVSLPH